ncbi:hypothetical protein MNBD_GAMMA11-135 [hydrothermal vent metagenome]|uniref:Lcl C-terminal domain-containing protein n=1 Tax=hydrothermal vent metagenome TaxID=652676 RepID=A0A3B0XB56_9ZZZZ
MKFIIQLAALLAILPGSTAVYAVCTSPGTNLNITKPDNLYTNNGDGTVSDNNTGLMWQACPLGLSGTGCATGTLQIETWQSTLATARTDTTGGYTDWRLPNKNELMSLIDFACFSPAINNGVFPATTLIPPPAGDFYWTSTPVLGSTSVNTLIWAIDFDNGSTTGASKDNANSGHVRLVRGMELLDSTAPAPTPTPPELIGG